MAFEIAQIMRAAALAALDAFKSRESAFKEFIAFLQFIDIFISLLVIYQAIVRLTLG